LDKGSVSSASRADRGTHVVLSTAILRRETVLGAIHTTGDLDVSLAGVRDEMSTLDEACRQDTGLGRAVDVILGAEGHRLVFVRGNVTTVAWGQENTEVVGVPDGSSLTGLTGLHRGKGRGGRGVSSGLGRGRSRVSGRNHVGSSGRGGDGGRSSVLNGRGSVLLGGSSGVLLGGGCVLLSRGCVLFLFLVNSSARDETDQDSQQQGNQEDGGAHTEYPFFSEGNGERGKAQETEGKRAALRKRVSKEVCPFIVFKSFVKKRA